jgi:hypothetical protein
MAAEFKIARLKYTWRGQWQAATVYNPDDVVSVSGKVYTCIDRHTSDAIFYTDLLDENTDIPPIADPKWLQIADGTNFVGEWQPAEEYFIGDIIKFGGVLYICTVGHFSAGSPANFTVDLDENNYWTIFFSSTNWTNNWSISTLYKLGDVVKYSGNLYICNLQHTSSELASPGLLSDLEKWDAFISNSAWKSNWINNNLYKVHDVVRYGGKLYICIEQHTSAASILNGLEINQSFWEEFLDGVEYKGSWTDNFRYKTNDIVKYGGYLYKSNQGHTVATLATFDSSKWEIFCPGQEYENDWSVNSLYQPGDIVRHGGFLYTSNITNSGSEPNWDQVNLNSNWNLLFNGTRIRGEWISSNTYRAGDVVRRSGQLYVAKRNVSQGNDVDIIDDNSSINSDDWELLISGSQWRGIWSEDVTYLIGDLALWKGGSYRCIVRHQSELLNRPDPAIGLGTEWEQYTFGNENNVLAFVGDFKTFGEFGTERLEIGNNGQALRSTSNTLSWSNFNQAANVYYVSLNGVDVPYNGTTLNSAWRTLRYALDRIVGPATVFVKTGIYNEVLPLRIPANVAIVGDELRGTVIKPAENYFTNDDIEKFEILIDFISSIIGNILTGVTITARLGSVKQTLTAPFATGAEILYAVDKLSLIKSRMTVSNTISIQSTNTLSSDANVLAAAAQLENNISFIQSESIAFLNINYQSYQYNQSVVESAIDRIIKAVQYDFNYTGNYKSLEAGKFFYNGSNAIQNKLENMFLLRDNTGLRNCTLSGLEGELSSYNIYQTKRPTAGAYASLDPGWGPADNTVWVGNRSPYVQNVTTFGTACVGLKIDGQLHLGGNKTIVANDFTQILSDGIGVWAKGDGGTEVVSVFTYYNHIGYLCTDGGKIRGTNGNCSYGEYGAVAEGFNVQETPILGIVNNQYYDATIGQVFTNGSNILKVFYSNAGQNYSTSSYAITGAGINASLLGDETRDGGVFQVRIANQNDSTNPAGNNYTLNINNAQAGDNISITLSASTDIIPSDLRGLRIVINSGTGAGQYGYIADYDNIGKIVLVGKENFEPLEVISTQASGNTLTIDSTDVYLKVGNPVCFTGNTLLGGLTANTIYYIASVSGSIITLLDNLSAPVTVTSEVGSMQINRLGWNHFQPGYEIATVLDTTSRYFIEPRVIFENPDRTATAGELADIDYWSSVAYGNGVWIAVTRGSDNNGEIVNYSTDGTSWVQHPMPVGGWTSVAYGDNKFVAVSADGKAATSVDGIIWNLSTISAAEYTSVIYGDNRWVAVASGGTRTSVSSDGITWVRGRLPTGADWSSVAYGKGIFIAVSQSDSTIANTAYSTNPIGGSFTDETTQAVLQRAVLITPTSPGQIALFAVFNTINPATGQLYVDLNGNGIIASADAAAMQRFVANISTDPNEISRCEQLLEAVLASPNISDIIREGYVNSWTLGSVPGGCKSVTYGNNRFVAIAGGYAGATDAYISFDGITWQVGEIDSANWTSVTYGQGMFVATASFENFVGYSTDGLEWRTLELDNAINWSSITYGKNGSIGKFVAIAEDSRIISEIVIGTTAEARVITESNRISEVLIFEPGSGYTTAPLITIFDPSNFADASLSVRIANGVLANPSIVDSGEGWQTTTTRITVTGDGVMDQYQTGNELILNSVTRIPGPGDNLVITGIDDFVYKVLTAEVLNGGPGNFQLRLIIAKSLGSNESPEHLTSVTIRQQYSQVRLTGHDFLDIGLGNFEQTNYPNTLFPNGTVISPQNEVKEANGGRCFYTTTDQDGNFRVGELFAVEQSTGTVTINAEFFELDGLEELKLGGVSVGGSGVVIREFSSDPLFIADSNNVVPTQRAIKEYIARRVSGGGSDAFTGQFTAGVVRVGPNRISTTTSEKINIPVPVKFKAPVSGKMLAMSYFVNSNSEDTGDRNSGQ